MQSCVGGHAISPEANIITGMPYKHANAGQNPRLFYS